MDTDKEENGMRKKQKTVLLAFFLTSAVSVCTFQTEAEAAGSSQKVSASASSTKEKTSKKKRRGWVTSKGKKYYYNSKGEKLKDTIRKIQGKFYYFDKNGCLKRNAFVRKNGNIYYADATGAFAAGWKKINKKQFYFSKRGRAVSGLQTINGKQYYFSKRGEMLKGWRWIGRTKYFFSRTTGRMMKDCTIEGQYIDENGSAELTAKELLDQKCEDILGQITNDSMSRSQKIQACWNYVVNGGFGYMTWRNYGWYSDWYVDYAYELLTRRRGNCYDFAAGFAYLCKAAGCNVTIVRGRVPGSRDGAADGYTRHCWVIVDGAYYDPEAAFAGWMYAYGTGSYNIAHQVQGYDNL